MLNGDAGIGFSLWKYRRSESQGFTASVTPPPSFHHSRVLHQSHFNRRSAQGCNRCEMCSVISTEGALRRPMTYGTFQRGVNKGAIDVRCAVLLGQKVLVEDL